MMNWRIVLGLFFYTFLCLGCAIFLMNDLVSFYYKKGKRKEIKKTQTLKDKVLFSKYKEKIPGIFYFGYYTAFIVNFILIVSYFIVFSIPEIKSYSKWIVVAHFIFNSIWFITPFIMFWQKDWRVKGFKYNRWLKK